MNEFNFDNQSMKDLANCVAAWVARHVLGLVSKKEKLAADIGNAYHRALEHHFSQAVKAKVVEVFAAEYDKIVPYGEQPEEPRFARQNCVKILERYCDTRPPSVFPFEVVELEKVKGVEIAPGLVFWVKRDMLVREKQTSQMAVVDHKTSSRLTDWFARRYRLTSQLTGYTWFTSQETGQLITKAYINGIEVGKLPDSTRKCKTHGVPYAECSAEHANFQLYQYTRTPEQIEKWKQDVLVLAKQAQVLAQGFGQIETLPYVMRNGAFNEACMFCEFSDWCQQGFAPELAGEYCVSDPWRPWEMGERVDKE